MSSEDESLPDEGSESGEDSWNEEEDLKDYRRGGYHPVRIGDRFKEERYRVLSKVGWGHFSTVWLAWDSTAVRPVVVKLQKSATRYSDAAKDEVEILRQITESANASGRFLVLLHDNFVHRGPNGLHHVMAFEVLGPTLLSLIKQTDYQGLPLRVVRRIAACVLIALMHLHENLAIIHTDLKPENVLCVLPPGHLDAMVKLAEEDAAAAAAKHEAAAAPGGDGGGSGGGGETLSKSAKRRLKAKEKAARAAQTAAAEADGAGDAASGEGGGNGNGHSGGESSGPAPPLDSRAGEPRIRQLRTPQIDLDCLGLSFKVADLGNACWVDRHFTDDIQTRQYRSPEVRSPDVPTRAPHMPCSTRTLATTCAGHWPPATGTGTGCYACTCARPRVLAASLTHSRGLSHTTDAPCSITLFW